MYQNCSCELFMPRISTLSIVPDTAFIRQLVSASATAPAEASASPPFFFQGALSSSSPHSTSTRPIDCPVRICSPRKHTPSNVEKITRDRSSTLYRLTGRRAIA